VTGKRFFPHGSQRFVDSNSQGFMQVGIRIGVNCKDSNFSQVNKRTDKKCTDCCLASPSFSADGDSKLTVWRKRNPLLTAY
jgi:hypothetical protein